MNTMVLLCMQDGSEDELINKRNTRLHANLVVFNLIKEAHAQRTNQSIVNMKLINNM